ncbi:nitroreductase/quinone reductase family protein [Novosphingobium bradum]|uniref:Nitroreductase/quinone reductase family protein n=1 Tax=Novosphingobium bradum TaxID=1737444 RepID=A0ABV7ISY5_9SPHN
MSDKSIPNPITRRVVNFVHEHRQAYLETGGAKGHILDIRASGGRSFATHCLIRYRGRKSGKTMITPLTYADIAGEVAIVASKGGADEHPSWYLNLTAADRIDFQIATQAFRATWREPEGAERQKVWDFLVDCHPFYANYQKRTDRRIPVVLMLGVEEIPVFQPGDIA